MTITHKKPSHKHSRAARECPFFHPYVCCIFFCICWKWSYLVGLAVCLREVIPVYLRTVSSNWFNKLPCFYKAVQTNYVILAGLCPMIQHRPHEVLYLCSSKNCGTSTCKSPFKSRLWMLGSLPVTASLLLSVFNNRGFKFGNEWMHLLSERTKTDHSTRISARATMKGAPS